MNFTFGKNDTYDLADISVNINIRVQQRNGRKSWTLIEGLETITNFDFKKTLKYLKKKLSCNGSIKDMEDDSGKFFQFQGDHREKIVEYLINIHNVNEESINVHGF